MSSEALQRRLAANKVNFDELRKRLRSDAVPQWYRDAIDAAVAFSEGFATQVENISRDVRLSEEGLRERRHALLRDGIEPQMRKIRERVASERQRLEAARAAFKLPEPDRGDLFGQSERQEIRAMLRSLPESERLKYLVTDDDRKWLSKADQDALPVVDAITLQAILEVPASRSGLHGPLWQRLQDHELRKLHGARMEQVAQELDALAAVDAAVQIATMQIASEAGPEPLASPQAAA